jgi:Type IV secretion system pilin
MKNKILTFLVAIFSSAILFSGATASTSYALNCGTNTDAKQAIECGVCGASGTCTDPAKAGARLDSTIERVINLVSAIAGALAVIMIIVAGFRYVTSAGNETSVASAKKTLLYAIIGLAIVALAQIIVRVVVEGVG